MKIAESWLREWVDPEFESAALAHQLTMLGHEVDALETDGEGLDGVIVGSVVSVEKHPDADKLSLCKVDDGSGVVVDVVCGAPNVVAGMKTPFARPGVTLPNGMKLRKAKIRGVVSNGMLCSAVELGLGDESDGILRLPDDAAAGASLTEFLDLPDTVIDLDLTPNRGDCFSVLGIARDVAALTGDTLKAVEVADTAVESDAVQPVELIEPAGCPRFAGRLVTGIDPDASSPLWMTERLRRAGLRAISPVVDVTNYVMLELGQPLHAYDAARLKGAIRPRMSARGESVELLDGRRVDLDDRTMVITDDNGVIGLAGIMGGLSTAVSDTTTDVFFEAAFWPQDVMAGRARAYGMHTDASLRFERGVDPEGQARAVQRATELLVAIAGGKAGELVDEVVTRHLPVRHEIILRKHRLARLLGLSIDDAIVTGILQRLGMKVSESSDSWTVTPPSYRFDISIEADLIEEVARIHGYDAIPETTASARSPLQTVTETRIDPARVAATLIARDYQEVVTYSFVDAEADRAFSGSATELRLANPISQDMAVMCSTLWPGIVAAASANVARQQDRVRIFEISNTFHGSLTEPREVLRIAGLVTGTRVAEQWSSKPENADFFDIKGDVLAVLALSADASEINFAEDGHAALQPGQAARILRGGAPIGRVGKLHPALARQYDLKRPVFVFELEAAAALASKAPVASTVSKYPAIRRDLAVIVDDNVSAQQLVDAVASTNPTLIRDVRIFDIYRGEGIEAGRKSAAISLILQETSRTLTDEDADGAMAAAVKKLEDQFAAVLRD